MKTTHTLGPWAHDDGHIFTELADRKYNSIATVHEIYDNNGNPETNAKVIAAAPEMYEQIQILRQFIIDNIDLLPNSEKIRFNALKVINEATT